MVYPLEGRLPERHMLFREMYGRGRWAVAGGRWENSLKNITLRVGTTQRGTCHIDNYIIGDKTLNGQLECEQYTPPE